MQEKRGFSALFKWKDNKILRIKEDSVSEIDNLIELIKEKQYSLAAVQNFTEKN